MRAAPAQTAAAWRAPLRTLHRRPGDTVGSRRARRGSGILVLQALSRTAITPELGLDPVDRRPVAICALAAVAELSKALQGGLVALEVEPPDQGRDGVPSRGGFVTGEGRADDERPPLG